MSEDADTPASAGRRAALRGEPGAPSYPGARRPDRFRPVSSDGLSLAVWEWGEETAPPMLVTHGGFDFAGTLDLLAPLLADAGWRVVSWDQRGHGDSERAALYSWQADVRDARAVLDTLGPDPLPVIGHSKGGTLMLQLAEALPHRVSHLANLDGLPSARSWPDVADHLRTRHRSGELTAWLEHRQETATKARRPGTIEELAERRRRMNPRLDPAWLRYLVQVGGFESDDGWRWKIDPAMRLGGFGPWRPEWSMDRLPALAMPVLCVLGMEPDMMGWGTLPEDVTAKLPPGGRFVPLEGVGHFVHIEQPARVAELILELVS